MGIILGALFFGLITFGFTLLTVVPLVLVWLMVGVYLETRSQPAAEAAAQAATVEAVQELRSTSVAVQEALAPGEHLVGAGR
jgi:hypothetical protein